MQQVGMAVQRMYAGNVLLFELCDSHVEDTVTAYPYLFAKHCFFP